MGDYINIPNAYLGDLSVNLTEKSRYLSRMWTRYRFGIFEDHTCFNHPKNIFKEDVGWEYCGGPSGDLSIFQQVSLCGMAAGGIAYQIGDLADKKFPFVKPVFQYRAYRWPRIIVALDSAMENKELSMVKAAFRMMLNYLKRDIGIGILGYNETDVTVYHEMSKTNQLHYDELTDSITFHHDFSAKSNLTSALEKAVQVIETYKSPAAGQAVFVIATAASCNEQVEKALAFAKAKKIRVSVIAYGLSVKQQYQLSTLTGKTNGIFYHVPKVINDNDKLDYILLLTGLEDGLVRALRHHGGELARFLPVSAPLHQLVNGKGKHLNSITKRNDSYNILIKSRKYICCPRKIPNAPFLPATLQ
jgi:von Willebrand factor type A domain